MTLAVATHLIDAGITGVALVLALAAWESIRSWRTKNGNGPEGTLHHDVEVLHEDNSKTRGLIHDMSSEFRLWRTLSDDRQQQQLSTLNEINRTGERTATILDERLPKS